MKHIRHDFMQTARDRAKAAIQAGRTEEALQAVDAIWEEGRPIHDLYGDMSAVFLDYIKEKLGEDAVEEAWRYVGERLWRPVLESYRDKDPALLAEIYAMFLRSHGYDFTCEEDDEKFQFFLHYCPERGADAPRGKSRNLRAPSHGSGSDAAAPRLEFSPKRCPVLLRAYQALV